MGDMSGNDRTAKIEGLFTNAPDNANWPSYMTAGSDFPMVSPLDYSKPYDHFYSNGAGAMIPDRVYHSRISSQERYVWQEIGFHVTEIQVVPSASGEESVVVALATPLAMDGSRAFFVVLDGETLLELGRAYLPADVRIAGTAHTTYVFKEQENSSAVTRGISCLLLALALLINA